MIKLVTCIDPGAPRAAVASGISTRAAVAPLWKVCDAPAGGCGAGRRKGRLTERRDCPTCGSELRVLKNQNRRSS